MGDGQIDFAVPFAGIFPLIGQSLIGFRMVISVAPAAAVLTKALFDEFLLLLFCVGIAEKGVHIQAAVHGICQKELVDLILRDEHFTPAQEIRLRGEVTLRIIQSIQHCPDSVGAILRQPKAHDAAVLLVCAEKIVVFLCQYRKAAFALGKGGHIVCQLRVTFVLVVDGQYLRAQSLAPAFLSQLTDGQHQLLGHLQQGMLPRLFQLCRRKVRSRLQQLQYSCRYLFPRYRGAAMAGANAVALRQMDTVLHEPHGVFLTIIFNAASVLCSELTAQECDIFRLGTLAHIERHHPVRAVIAVARRIQRLVDDRLRHCAGGEQFAHTLRLRHLVDGSSAAHVKEGKLLRHHRRVL